MRHSNPIAATASLLQMAKQHCDAHESVALDAQTNPLRRAQYLLQRTVNSYHSTMEISDQQVREYSTWVRTHVIEICVQAAFTCLGHAADQCSHKMWIVYIGAAVKV